MTETMPEEIFAHEMSANSNGRHGGWVNGAWTPPDSTRVQYLLKTTVDAQRAEFKREIKALKHDNKRLLEISGDICAATREDDKTIERLREALEHYQEKAISIRNSSNSNPVNTTKIEAVIMELMIDGGNRAHKALSDNAPRIAQVNHIADVSKKVGEANE